jgi:hypothetical protein
MPAIKVRGFAFTSLTGSVLCSERCFNLLRHARVEEQCESLVASGTIDVP